MVPSTRNIKMLMHVMQNHMHIYQWFCLSIKGHQSPIKVNAHDKTHHKDTKFLNLNLTYKLLDSYVCIIINPTYQ